MVQTRKQRWMKVVGRATRELRAPSKTLADSVRFSGPRFVLQLKDLQIKVTLIGKSKIGDAEVIGIQLSSRSGEKFYFDAGSGMLVSQKSANWETIYQDYEKVNGIPIAKQITKKRKGEVWITTKVLEFKVVDKLDPALFRKP